MTQEVTENAFSVEAEDPSSCDTGADLGNFAVT